MTPRSRILLALSLGTCLALGAPAHGNSRTSAFAPADPGVRAAAMGGAYSAVGGEPMALYWNPATLFFQTERLIEATYSDLYSLGAAQRSYLSYGWKSSFEIPDYDGDRVVISRDDRSGPGYGFSVQSLFFDLEDAAYTEFSLGAAAAWGYGDRLALGASARGLLISSDLDQVSAWGYDIGLGMAWHYSQKERIGISVPNLLSRVIWTFESTERLPIGVNLGWARVFSPALVVSADVELREGNTGMYRAAVGGEWWAFPDRIAVRAGYRYLDGGLESFSAPTFGLAVRLLSLRLDYAYRVEPDLLGDTHRVALLIGL